MDAIYENKMFCLNLTEGLGQYVKEWSNNETSDEIIEFDVAPATPHLFFTPWTVGDQSKYQWCGPTLLLPEYFAKLTKTKIKLNPYRPADETVQRLLDNGIEAFSHIFLAGVTTSGFYRWVVEKYLTDFLDISSYFTHTNPDCIMATTKKGTDTMFKHFECFESEVYYGIIASIIVISFVISVYKHSLKSFFTTFWSYLSIVLSDYRSFQKDNGFDRMLSGLWLMACTVLLASFSGKLIDKVRQPLPIQWIDSFDDLYEWKHMEILTSSSSDLADYIEIFNKEQYQGEKAWIFARDFKSRTNWSDTDGQNHDRELSNIIDFNALRSGRLAIVYNFDYLQIFKQTLTDYGLEEDFDFHISNPNQKPQLLFTMFNKEKMTKENKKIWNLVLSVFRESGIYSELQKRSFDPGRLGHNFGSGSYNGRRIIIQLQLKQLKLTFILFLIFMSTFNLILVFELSYKGFK